eukprot:CAMPEP_0194498016 /NCGR_PEP_ID=MMETSP0253-20130528/14778_1 /TAXON_ID=2966 /ORGANISM="Noctiluca scintillans" /LENGTH=89 /DNA_ID=CAMNT_0039339587 /DNA_START=314 /DNA_END=579 /DNA_ORIENTATION=-
MPSEEQQLRVRARTPPSPIGLLLTSPPLRETPSSDSDAAMDLPAWTVSEHVEPVILREEERLSSHARTPPPPRQSSAPLRETPSSDSDA